jgi:ABC-type lipoprotein export system ATPase subunit
MTESMPEIVESPEIVDLPSATDRPARRARPRYGDQALIVCDNLVKIYKVADLEVVALQGLDLLIESGEFVALIGASGSGKSTLLNILGGLDVPSAGRAVVAGYQLDQLSTADQTRYLRQVIGFVWQQTARNLLPYLTAAENVALPMILDGVPAHARNSRALELLRQVDLADRADHRPDRLSGGEQQRVAIAVALANGPDVILADEPTGQLDTTTGHQIFELFRRLNHELGVTIVVATHDPLVSEQVARTVAIRDGRVSSETLRQRTVTGEGDHHVISTEYAVLDRAGRLQLPRSHVEALGLAHRVRLELEEDHVGVWPDRPEVPERPERPGEADLPAASAEVERPAPQRSSAPEPPAPPPGPASDGPAPPPTTPTPSPTVAPPVPPSRPLDRGDR